MDLKRTPSSSGKADDFHAEGQRYLGALQRTGHDDGQHDAEPSIVPAGVDHRVVVRTGEHVFTACGAREHPHNVADGIDPGSQACREHEIAQALGRRDVRCRQIRAGEAVGTFAKAGEVLQHRHDRSSCRFAHLIQQAEEGDAADLAQCHRRLIRRGGVEPPVHGSDDAVRCVPFDGDHERKLKFLEVACVERLQLQQLRA